MRRLSRRRRPISDINVVPYLDVLLVLLVIFMITAPLFNQGVVDLPKAGKNPTASAAGATFQITYTDKLVNPYILASRKDKSEIDNLNIEDLEQELGKQGILYDNVTVIISADGDRKYNEIMELVGKLQDIGYAVGLEVEAEN